MFFFELLQGRIQTENLTDAFTTNLNAKLLQSQSFGLHNRIIEGRIDALTFCFKYPSYFVSGGRRVYT